jgi:hypothetical protein
MMNISNVRYFRCLPAALAVAAVCEARAAPITVTAEAPGILAPSVSAATVLTFENLPVGALSSYTFEGGTLAGAGAILDSTVSHAAQPFGDATKYLAVSYAAPTGSVSLSFSSPQNYFGLYWGSIDDWNSITFFNGNAQIASFSGADAAGLTGLLANGDQQSFASNRYIEFDLEDAFYNDVVLATTSWNFEIDNIAFGDPPALIAEPGTLPLLGLVLPGVALMRRRGFLAQYDLGIPRTCWPI